MATVKAVLLHDAAAELSALTEIAISHAFRPSHTDVAVSKAASTSILRSNTFEAAGHTCLHLPQEPLSMLLCVTLIVFYVVKRHNKSQSAVLLVLLRIKLRNMRRCDVFCDVQLN